MDSDCSHEIKRCLFLGKKAMTNLDSIFKSRNIHITYKIDSQWDFAVWLRKLKQGLCINLEGWDGEGDGREVYKGGDICIPMADSC